MKTPVAFALAALPLAACTQDRHVYPSLAPRAVERVGFTEPVRPVAVATPDPALDADIARLRGTLATVTAGFAADAAKAQAAADRARGAAPGSDPWLEAQTALAQLDDWRAQSSSLLTDVETRASERAGKLLPAYPALDALRETIAAENAKQAAMIDRLQRGLTPA